MNHSDKNMMNYPEDLLVLAKKTGIASLENVAFAGDRIPSFAATGEISAVSFGMNAVKRGRAAGSFEFEAPETAVERDKLLGWEELRTVSSSLKALGAGGIFLDEDALSVITSLEALEYLDLPGVMNQSLARLSRCLKLKNLSLANAPALIDAGIPVIPSLKSIDLRDCQELEKLSWNEEWEMLERLNLDHSGVSDVSLDGLSKMQMITLSGCANLRKLKITNLPKLEKLQINGCSALESIEIVSSFQWASGSMIDLSGLGKLREVKIDDCPGLHDIKAIGCGQLSRLRLSKMKMLKTLEICHCRSLESVVDWESVVHQDSMQTLHFYDSRVQQLWIPNGRELKENVLEPVRERLRRFKDEGLVDASDRVHHCKVVIVGNPWVGKTWLLWSLTDPSWRHRSDKDQRIEHTNDVQSTQWSQKKILPIEVLKPNEDANVVFWDFAGQAELHDLHRFFLSSGAMFVFVWNTDREDECPDRERWSVQYSPDYWLDQIYSVNPGASVLAVRSKRRSGKEEKVTDLLRGRVSRRHQIKINKGLIKVIDGDAKEIRDGLDNDFVPSFLKWMGENVVRANLHYLLKGDAKMACELHKARTVSGGGNAKVPRVEFKRWAVDHCPKAIGIENLCRDFSLQGLLFYDAGVSEGDIYLDERQLFKNIYRFAQSALFNKADVEELVERSAMFSCPGEVESMLKRFNFAIRLKKGAVKNVDAGFEGWIVPAKCELFYEVPQNEGKSRSCYWGRPDGVNHLIGLHFMNDVFRHVIEHDGLSEIRIFKGVVTFLSRNRCPARIQWQPWEGHGKARSFGGEFSMHLEGANEEMTGQDFDEIKAGLTRIEGWGDAWAETAHDRAEVGATGRPKYGDAYAALSWARADADLFPGLNEMATHVLNNMGFPIEIHSKRKWTLATNVQERRISQATVVVFLIGPGFVESKFCVGELLRTYYSHEKSLCKNHIIVMPQVREAFYASAKAAFIKTATIVQELASGRPKSELEVEVEKLEVEKIWNLLELHTPRINFDLKTFKEKLKSKVETWRSCNTFEHQSKTADGGNT